MPGPPPKRAEERRRRNKDTIEIETVDLDTLIAGEVEVPLADEDWHPTAKMVWESLKRSGQSIFMEPSDWATAHLLCTSISRDLKPQFVGITNEGEVIEREIPLKGASLNAYLKGFGSLMMLEGDRRRLRIELDRKKARDAQAVGEGVVVPITKERQARFTRPAQQG